MNRLLREPLLHFLALGLGLFLLFQWRGGGSAGRRIVVTRGQVEHLAAGFARARMRTPSEQELKGLIDEQVKEEIATREAVAAGLDRDDPVIRQRLRQKLEFLVDDGVDQGAPTEADLQRWLDAHPGAVPLEPRVALRQVLVGTARHGAGVRAEAERLLVRLRAAGSSVDPSRVGDPSLLPGELSLVPIGEVSRTFGEPFAKAVAAAAPGEWTGPVESTYGLHLVLVRERIAARRPELSEIRPLVEREVVSERRREALDALYRSLLAKYPVTIEWPRPAGVAAATAGAEASR